MHRRLFIGMAGSALTMLQTTRATWSAAPSMAVDTHAHIFLHSLPMTAHRRYTPDYDASLSDYLAMLEQDGSTHGVLIQPSFLGFDNTFLLAALAKHPDRLRGIVVVAPETPRHQLADLSHQGIVGIRLNLIGEETPDFRAPVWRRHLKDVADLGWQVEVQAEADRLSKIIPPILASGATAVIDHFGRPDKATGVDDPGFRYLLSTAKTSHVYVKLSAPYRLGPDGQGHRIAREAAPLLLSAFGPDRLLWGSDWPHTEFEKTAPGPKEMRAELDQWVPDAAQRQHILGTAAAHLFKFEKEPAKKRAL